MSDKSVDVLAVFSGECLKGVCGIDTGFKDLAGEPLRVGDIVQCYTVVEYSTEHGPMLDYMPGGLTAVVSDEWTTFNGGEYVRKEGEPAYFVMGIASVDLDGPGHWRVRKLKGYEDAIPGEHWRDYGFNYRVAPAAALARCGGQP